MPRPNMGGVAQMEERSLCMREVPGSIPGVSTVKVPVLTVTHVNMAELV